MTAAPLGTVSETVDGDGPFLPKGGTARACSVAEALPAQRLIENARLAARRPPAATQERTAP